MKTPSTLPAVKSSIAVFADGARVRRVERARRSRRARCASANPRRRKKSRALRPDQHQLDLLARALDDEVAGRLDDVRVEAARQPLVGRHDDQLNPRARPAARRARRAAGACRRRRGSARLCSTRSICLLNGRALTMRSYARRMRLAATIFIALVICCVDLTARIRRRMSIREGMVIAADRNSSLVIATAFSRSPRHVLHELLQQAVQLRLQLVVDQPSSRRSRVSTDGWCVSKKVWSCSSRPRIASTSTASK